MKKPNSKVQTDFVTKLFPRFRTLVYVGRSENYYIISYRDEGKATHFHKLVIKVKNRRVIKCYNFLEGSGSDIDFFFYSLSGGKYELRDTWDL